MNFYEEYKKLKCAFETYLERSVTADVPARLRESMNYSLLGGGKRLRPVLYLSVLCSYGITPRESDYRFASAIECVHTYSLIHDDLPVMDNDDVRRGRPTNHKVYGEATALLAGDALLTLAFELAGKCAALDPLYAEAVYVLARNAGACGMVGGQAMEFSCGTPDAKLLSNITLLKTGKLIEASVICGTIAADRKENIAAWLDFSDSFGKAFQLCDDLLDIEKGEHSLASVLGKDNAKKYLNELTERAVNALDKTDGNTEFLGELTKAVLLRAKDGI